MIYQLPNGKVINLTIEEYLDLDDQDIQYLMSINAGNYATSLFYGSVIRKKREPLPDEDIDKSLDYEEEDPDRSHGDNVGGEEIILDDITDFPDQMIDEQQAETCLAFFIYTQIFIMISTLNAENSAVTVTAVSGNVVIPSKKNALWGYICVAQTRIVVDERGFAALKPVKALIHGLVKDLKKFGWVEGQELKGTIIFKEQMQSFNSKEPERDYKVAGKTGIVCCIDGYPMYRKTFYSSNPNAEDVYILDKDGNRMSHTNGDEIRLAYKQMAEEGIQLDDNAPIDAI